MNPTDFIQKHITEALGETTAGDMKAGKEKAGKRSGSARLFLTSLSNTCLRNKLLQEPFHEKHLTGDINREKQYQ
ncbi:hypothetical protein RTS15_003346 [Salmonella enterica]|nr:hypothetical protein [Salmonella enterica]ELJ4824686.1 hypothetical protein [Salmonella enterica]